MKSQGDELHSSIPSMPLITNQNRDLVYSGSEITVERGDHIRIQDINLRYNIPDLKAIPFKSLSIYAYMRDPGLIWTANSKGLDPDALNGRYPMVTRVSLGIVANF